MIHQKAAGVQGEQRGGGRVQGEAEGEGGGRGGGAEEEVGGRDGGEGAAGADERRQAQDEETGEFYPEIRTYVVKGFENALFLVQ